MKKRILSVLLLGAVIAAALFVAAAFTHPGFVLPGKSSTLSDVSKRPAEPEGTPNPEGFQSLGPGDKDQSEEAAPDATNYQINTWPPVPQTTYPAVKKGSGVKIAYLTFDDGPARVGGKATNGTQNLLNILKAHSIRATFFLVGQHVYENPELTREIVQDGNTVGSHTWSHANLNKLTPQQFKWQIDETNLAIFRITGVQPKLFRPPHGIPPDKEQKAYFKKLGMKVFLWTVDSRDWAKATDNQILNNIKKGIETKKDLIILFHDADFSELDDVIRLLEKNGYQFDTLDHT